MYEYSAWVFFNTSANTIPEYFLRSINFFSLNKRSQMSQMFKAVETQTVQELNEIVKN